VRSHGVHSHKRFTGEIAPGVAPKDAKMCFVFRQQYNTDFWPLILHQFWPFLKRRTWISVRMRKPMTNFRISAQGVSQVPKTGKNGYFLVGVCDKVTAQTA